MEMKWLVLALAVVMYLLVICFQNKKIWFTTLAALIIVVLSVFQPEKIFNLGSYTNAPSLAVLYHVFFELINWNVLMIYVGSMIIAALFIYSRVPACIADKITEISPSTGIAIVLILAMTGIISIFVENVATVLVMAPIALAMCKKLKLNPTCFLIGLAVMSNLEGTATLVGDPPSMIFASYANYTFNDFFFHNGHLSIFFIIQAGMLSGCIFFYFFFAKAKTKPEIEKTVPVSYVPAVLLVLMIVGLALISFLPEAVTESFSCFSGSFVMLLGLAGIFWYKVPQKKTKQETFDMIKDLDWETICFLIGIFVVVGAINETGLLSDFADFLAVVCGGSVVAGFLLIMAVSVIISGFVDNVPYIIVMLPVAGILAESMGIAKELFMFALLIGSCLGGNLTPYGASANVVTMGILKKEGYPINFGKWLQIGGTFTILTTTVAALVLWLLWA